MEESYYTSPSDAGYHDTMDGGYAAPLHPYDSPETGGIFGDIVHAVSSVARTVASPVSHAVSSVGGLISQGTHLLQGGLKALTNNPLWDIAKTGISFIPGVGTAVSAGMAGAAALGKGASLADIGLAAARGAIPGGAITQAAFDVATGLAKGQNVTDSILQAARSQLPGGDVAKAAFDAATAIAKGQALNTVALNAIRRNVPGGAAGQAAFDVAIAKFKQAKGAAASVPSYPQIPQAANMVARALHATPALRALPAANVARELATSISNVQSAIAAIMNRLKGMPQFNTGDVGAVDSLNTCCEREELNTGALDYDTGVSWGADDTGFAWQGDAFGAGLSGTRVRLPMSPAHVMALLHHSRVPMRMGILAHGLLPRLYHQTGELDQAGGWIIRSGESPFAIAQKLTGNGNRWREILAVNPGLKVVQKGSTTLVQPFNPGQRITIPASWLGTAAPVPKPPAPGMPPVPVPVPGPPVVVQGGPATPITTFPSSSSASTLPMLRKGDGKANGKAPGVMLWQSLLLKLGSTLVGAADGEFGPKTDAATRGYQTRMGLTVDGIVGPLTWGAALRELEGKVGVPVAPPPAAPPVGPAVPSAAPEPKTAALQAALGFFYQHHGSEVRVGLFANPTVPSFGSLPDDMSGSYGDRTQQAMLGFQNWRNTHPLVGAMPLPEDGKADQNSVNALLAQNALDLQGVGVDLSKVPVPVPGSATPIPTPPAIPPVPPTKAGAGGGGDIVPLAIGIAVLAALASEPKRRAA